METFQFLPKLGKSLSEMFQMIKEAYSRSAVFKKHRLLHKVETVWKMRSIAVSEEWLEINSRSKKLQLWCVPTTTKW
jgi:hypothetical protein